MYDDMHIFMTNFIGILLNTDDIEMEALPLVKVGSLVAISSSLTTCHVGLYYN